jgi:hypothetical protein
VGAEGGADLGPLDRDEVMAESVNQAFQMNVDSRLPLMDASKSCVSR